MPNENEQAVILKEKKIEGVPGGVPGSCGIVPAIASTKCETIIKIRGSKICQGCQYRFKYK